MRLQVIGQDMPRVLTISAHPDDETLGCGGTLLKHRQHGDQLYWLIATVCHEPQWSADTIRCKAAEVEQVADAFGMERTFRLGFPNARLDTIAISDLMAPIATCVDEVRPEIVYLLHGGDIHTDHFMLFTATMSVLKPFYMVKRGVRRVLCYETLSSTDAAPPRWERAFVPSVFSDISPYIDQKIDIMKLYATEIHPDPMPRGESAIRALARYRGTTISTEYAEAFTLVRELM
jgi:LmbE family N-acetylglucosaminyl deacetylase